MVDFSSEILGNRGLLNGALAFNEQLPIGSSAGTRIGGEEPSVPAAVTMLHNGNALIQFYAPAAGRVCLKLFDRQIFLKKDGDGIWRGEIPYTTPGFKAVTFEVDGTEVLCAMAPIGFGFSQPVNYIEFPEVDCDFYYIKDVPHGTIAQEFYYSKTTGQYESCMLYLPPEYTKETENTYPVLYLQHGHGENEKCWIYQGKVNFIMDNLLAQGACVPCIIVMNNGMVHAADDTGNPCMDSSLLEALLIDDCIPFIEGKYRVKTQREFRAMAGLSMGSMQTSVITMKHPELFSYVGIFSGFIHDLVEKKGLNEHLKALDDRDAFINNYKLFMRAMGTEDHFKEVFESDNDILARKGLSPEEFPAHRIFYYPGGHEWQVWRKCILDFLQLVFK